MENYLPVLETLPLFAGIVPSEIVPLCCAFDCYTRRFGAGELLWLRGDHVSAAGIVLSGSVQAERNAPDGTQHIVARHGVGALFGDVLMSSQMQRSPVDILACEETMVLFLPLARIMCDVVGEIAAVQVRFRLNLLGEISDKYWALYSRQKSIFSTATNVLPLC